MRTIDPEPVLAKLASANSAHSENPPFSANRTLARPAFVPSRRPAPYNCSRPTRKSTGLHCSKLLDKPKGAARAAIARRGRELFAFLRQLLS